MLTSDIRINLVMFFYRRVMMIVIWTKKYMLRPVAHCRSECVWGERGNVRREKGKMKEKERC